jgi:tetratricopeptide (TPR) repeat protein
MMHWQGTEWLVSWAAQAAVIYYGLLACACTIAAPAATVWQTTAETYYQAGASRLQAGDAAGAAESFAQALEVDPGYVPALYGRGLARLDLADAQGASEDFTAVLSRNSSFAPAYNNRGLARVRLGAMAGAMEDFNAALALTPSLAAAYNNRGALRLLNGDVAGAVEDLTAALNLAPDLGDAHYNRALARLRYPDHPAVQAVPLIDDSRRARELGLPSPSTGSRGDSGGRYESQYGPPPGLPRLAGSGITEVDRLGQVDSQSPQSVR